MSLNETAILVIQNMKQVKSNSSHFRFIPFMFTHTHTHTHSEREREREKQRKNFRGLHTNIHASCGYAPLLRAN